MNSCVLDPDRSQPKLLRDGKAESHVGLQGDGIV